MTPFERNIRSFNRQLTGKNLACSNTEQLEHSNPDGIIILGMGGSALAGGILKGIQKEIGLNVPVVIWKDYGIPEQNFRNPLFIFVSFSGGTEETLSGIKTLLKSRKRPLIAVITSGGELRSITMKNHLPLISFSAGDLTPRQSTGNMFYSLIKVLRAAGFPLKTADYIRLKPERFFNAGKALAQKLRNRLVVIYTDSSHDYLGYIWKIKFNETAKTPAFNNVLPEMNHNETVGFTKSRFPTAAIFLGTPAHPRVKKRFRLTESLLKKRGIQTFKVPLQGKNELEKTWNTIMLADWTAFFLAKLNRVDPEKTEIIDTLKQLMKS